jgi:two-component system NtrC family sensor kinase
MKKIVFLIAFFTVGANLVGQNLQVDSILKLIPAEKTDTGKVRKLIEVGRLMNFGMVKNDSSQLYLQQAVDLSKKINSKPLEAEATFYLANYLVNSANNPRALVLSLQNLKLIEQLKKEQGIEITLTQDRNLKFFQTRLLVFIYSNIRDYEKQLEYVRQMQAIYASMLQQQPGVSENYKFTLYFNQANAFENLKNPDSAFYYLSKLYDAVAKDGDAQWRALVSNALGTHYKKQNNEDSAMLYSRKALAPAIESNRTDILTAAELRIGELFEKKGQIDSAFYYSRRALNRLSSLNLPTILQDANKQLSDLFKSAGRYDSAYKYLLDFVILKDSLYDFSKIAEARNFAFNQTLVDQQVEQAKKEAIQQANARTKMYALAGVIAFILLATFLLMYNLKQKREANVLLTRQKEEIQNSLSALREAQAQLIQSEKMASLGELTAGIAHEIQNPLNFVTNFSEVNSELIDELMEEIDNEDLAAVKSTAIIIKENESKINHHGKRADSIVKSMLQHSRSSNGKKEATDINALCDEYLRLSYHGLRARDKSFNASLQSEYDASIGMINIVPSDIGRVIMNLFTNAFYAVNEKQKLIAENEASFEPTVSIITNSILVSGSRAVEIRITDNGNGIPQKILEKIFQPFFTTKPTGSGTGLGLSLSYDIIKNHGGTLKVETKEKEFTSFIITLPIQTNTNI